MKQRNHDDNMSGDSRSSCTLLTVLALAGCGASADLKAEQLPPSCDRISAIEGTYDCKGECVVGQELVTVEGEVDTIERYPGAHEDLYRVDVSGAAQFRETELGALVGSVLRTATSQVSDGKYPVLEEDTFSHDATCRATGFIKTVRNPTAADFKVCRISCGKRP